MGDMVANGDCLAGFRCGFGCDARAIAAALTGRHHEEMLQNQGEGCYILSQELVNLPALIVIAFLVLFDTSQSASGSPTLNTALKSTDIIG